MTSPLDMPILQPIPIETKTRNYWLRPFIWNLSRRRFRVVSNWDFQLPNGRPKIRICKDFEFDGASIPRAFWWLLSPVGLLFIPGLIHDYAYTYNKLIEIKDDGKEEDFIVKDHPKQYWDAVFRDVALEINGFLIILWVAWLFLAIFGWIAWWEHRKQWILSILALLAANLTIGGGIYLLIF